MKKNIYNSETTVGQKSTSGSDSKMNRVPEGNHHRVSGGDLQEMMPPSFGARLREKLSPGSLRYFFIDLSATGFFFGRIPFMPGTWGTLWGIPLAIMLFRFGPFVYMGATLAFLLASIFIAEAYEKIHHTHDPKEIVIDEIVGFAITMTWLPMTWQSLLAGFIAFRFFDILKPFPISYLDRKIEGGLGTVIDDAVAGMFANIVLQIVFTRTAWLGMQLHGHV